MGKQLDDDTVRLTVKAVQSQGSIRAAAKVLGIDRKTVRRHLIRAAERGLDDSVPFAAPDGFIVKQNTVQYDKSGNRKGQSVKFGTDHGGSFSAPPDHAIKGVSALLDQDGNVRQQWVKTTHGQPSGDSIAEIFIKRAQEIPAAPAITKAHKTLDDWLTVYIFTDLHLGMYAWGEEAQEDWDLKLAQDKFTTTFTQLVSMSKAGSQALFLGLGDLFHADNRDNRTEGHGHALDVDSRYDKVVGVGQDLFTHFTDMIAQNHDKVDVRLVQGNHDERTSVALAGFMRAWFRNEERIKVNSAVNPFCYHRFGVNLIGGHHGHKAKREKLPLVMANDKPQDWAETKTRHWHTGHIHHDTLKEEGGVCVYSHRAPIPTDAYNFAAGYRSGQTMKSFAYHKESGAVSYTEEPVL